MSRLFSRIFSLHRQYVLLGTEDPDKPVHAVPRKRRRLALVVALFVPCALLGLLIATIVLAVKLNKRPTPRPLDRYQHM